MRPAIPIKLGTRFGLWTVVSEETRPSGSATNRGHRVLCRCECGTEKWLLKTNLKRGTTRSCGCQKGKHVSENRAIHGQSGTSMYHRWSTMIARCENPNKRNYKDYGGRGIKIHPPWRHDFLAFERYVRRYLGECPSPQHTIGRIDFDKDFEPGNLRWATVRAQNNNTRKNVYLTFRGRTATVAQWARITGLSVGAIYQRITRLGWSVERALTQPVQVQRKNPEVPEK